MAPNIKAAVAETALEKIVTIKSQLEGTAIVVPGEVKFDLIKVKEVIEEIKEEYGNLALTEDQVKNGKEVRSQLNKVEKFIGDFRKSKVEEYKVPINILEKECKNMESTIKETSNFIGDQLNKFEEIKKEEKKSLILNLIDDLKEELETPKANIIINEKWLNVSVFSNADLEKGKVPKKIKEEIEQQIVDYVKVLMLEQEKEKALLEKKEFLEGLMNEKNELSGLTEKVKYTELEQYLEFSLNEMKECVNTHFENRIENQRIFNENIENQKKEAEEKERLRAEQLPKKEEVVENKVEVQVQEVKAPTKLLKTYSLLVSEEEIIIIDKFLTENNIKFNRN